MTPERWRRVEALFHSALDREPSVREAFLGDTCADDPSLRQEVSSLLAAYDEAGTFIDAPAVQAVPAAAPGPAPIAFGPYRVCGALGEGGMGVVYLAERNDGQFTRRVAVKRVGSAAPNPEALRRFSDERQILARLDHPNITRLLDSGLDDAGVPYLVMEHVEGLPATSYCREHRLPVRQRLALFLKVCAAVQHAHRSLVIHRDIKPGNILVTPAGEPKLLDFGIAKFLGEPVGAAPTVNRALTLDFASPEQVRGEAVTTASDVYSLGVLLFELLADVRPYDAGGRSLSEAVQMVCVLAPPPPSRVAPVERRAELAGDLDSIVRKATEKAPADRYASAAELASDVAAHLGHFPVKARRPPFGYATLKFVRRHRAGSAAATAALLLAAGGVAAVLHQARVAERERARAERRFAQVQQLANYMIFDLHDGISMLAGSTELRRKMVERSLAHLDSLAAEAAGDQRLQVELAGGYLRLGAVLGEPNAANLGDRAGALVSYGKARDLLRQVVAAKPDQMEARRALGRLLLRLHGAYGLERKEERARALQESMAIWQELVRQEPAAEENLRGLASAHFAAHHEEQVSSPERAVTHLERALEIFQGLLKAQPDDLDRKRNVALCHKYLTEHFAGRDPARAHQHALRATQLDAERLAAEPHSALAKMDYTFDLGNVAGYHLERGDYDEALRLYEQALVLRRELAAADPANVQARDRLGYVLTRVANVHVRAGRPRLAVPLLQEAVEKALSLPEADAGRAQTLFLAYRLQGEVALALGRDPCPSFRRMAGQQTKAAAVLKREVVLRALERLKSCPGPAAQRQPAPATP